MEHHFCNCGLYYKHITIINYDSSIINKFAASLTDVARVVIYNHHMFTVHATDYSTAVLAPKMCSIPCILDFYEVDTEI